MKKMSLVMALLAGFSVFPVSAQEVVCAYSPLQNLLEQSNLQMKLLL